jgi:hypothetical protein
MAIGLFGLLLTNKGPGVNAITQCLMCVGLLGVLISIAIRSVAAKAETLQTNYDTLKKQVDELIANAKNQQ